MAVTRRAALRATASLSVGLVAGLSGCFGGNGGNGDGCDPLPEEPDYKGWFDGVSNYDDATCDYRERDEVTVRVGVSGDIGFYKFGPPALAVSPGTTLTWEWTGKGGAHNVVAEQGAFDSGKPVTGESRTFEYAFDQPGIYRYVCEPHRSANMKAAVFVGLE